MNWLLRTSLMAWSALALALAAVGAQPIYVNRGTTFYAQPAAVPRIPGGLIAAREFPAPSISPIFINPGNITFTNPPQIDATAFLNLGNFNVLTTLPYDFQNTLYYTNRGSMIGAPGFRFDYTDGSGIRRPAAQWINEAPGTVQTVEFNGYSGYSNTFFQTMMDIRATNVVNAGYIGVDNAGSLRIEGQSVNLTRGGMEVRSLLAAPIANSYLDQTDDGIPDAFYGDSAIYDLYWGAGIQPVPIPGPINTANVLRFNGTDVIASSGTHQVQSGPGWANGFAAVSAYAPATYLTAWGNTGVVASTFLTLTNFDGSLSNLIIPTNIFRQAVVVGLGDTNFTVRTRFGLGGPAGMGMGIVAVEIASTTTNVVQGQRETNALYFVDYLGYDTNTLILTNLGPWVATGRPYAYEVYRELPGFIGFGANGNAPLTNGFLYNQSFSNVFATNMYAAYGASVDNLESRPPLVQGVSPTNTPGRIEIKGDVVDLTKARIRGMSTVDIKARHLKCSSEASIDVENLVFDLASTNGLLTVQNLAKTSTHAVRGELLAWTGIWSNQFALVLSNWFIDANTNYFNPVTNPIDINLYCLILNADFLTRTQQVLTHSLALSSTNVAVNDEFIVSTKLAIQSESLTVNGMIALTNAIPDWNYSLTPGLRFLTNNGTIRPWGVGYFGTDFPAGRQLETFVNNGDLEGVAHEIACGHFEDAGTIETDIDLRLTAREAILQGSLHDIGGSAEYSGGDYKLRGHRLVTGRGLILNVTNSLADAGAESNNSIEVADGFHLLRRPQSGDLFGTRFLTRAPRFASVAHTWTAEDRGATSAGFSNNTVVGRLVLDSLSFGELRLGPPVNTGGSHALYVDYLELSTNRYAGGQPSVAEDPEAYLVIEPGLTVYFAMSNLDPAGLDGRFENRLRWVPDFAGPASGIDVALRNGRTVRVNLGVLQSQEIDSDGDGVANGLDLYPFDDLLITNFRLVSSNPPVVELSWRAAARTPYSVSYTTNLLAPDWQVIAHMTNPEPYVQILTVTHRPEGTVPANDAQRYYRVSYEP